MSPHQKTRAEPAEQLMLSGKMVLVVTTTLVHLAVLGSGALFGSWRIEDQVREERREARDRKRGERIYRTHSRHTAVLVQQARIFIYVHTDAVEGQCARVCVQAVSFRAPFTLTVLVVIRVSHTLKH